MKYLDLQVIYDFCWSTVTLAWWNKYPNVYNPSIISVDYIDQYMDEKNRIHTFKLIAIDTHIPYLLSKVLFIDSPYKALEYSIVDRDAKVNKLFTINLSMSSIVTANEYIVYEAFTDEKDQKEKVKMNQHVEFISMDIPLKSYAEEFLINNVQSNVNKGINAINEKASLIELFSRLPRLKMPSSTQFTPHLHRFSLKLLPTSLFDTQALSVPTGELTTTLLNSASGVNSTVQHIDSDTVSVVTESAIQSKTDISTSTLSSNKSTDISTSSDTPALFDGETTSMSSVESKAVSASEPNKLPQLQSDDIPIEKFDDKPSTILISYSSKSDNLPANLVESNLPTDLIEPSLPNSLQKADSVTDIAKSDLPIDLVDLGSPNDLQKSGSVTDIVESELTSADSTQNVDSTLSLLETNFYIFSFESPPRFKIPKLTK